MNTKELKDILELKFEELKEATEHLKGLNKEDNEHEYYLAIYKEFYLKCEIADIYEELEKLEDTILIEGLEFRLELLKEILKALQTEKELYEEFKSKQSEIIYKLKQLGKEF